MCENNIKIEEKENLTLWELIGGSLITCYTYFF